MANCDYNCPEMKNLASRVDKLEANQVEIKDTQNKWITKTAVQDNAIQTFNENFRELKDDLKKIGYKTIGSVLFLVLVQIMGLIFIKS